MTDPHSTTDDDNGGAGVDDCYSDPNYWLERVQRVIAEVAAEYAAAGAPQKHLISVDELRAAGALDVPPAWRKSLANESRFTLPGFGDDATSQSDTHVDTECVEPADDPS